MWLVKRDQQCPVCHARHLDEGETRSLHLVASAGFSEHSAADLTRVDGAFHRFVVGERKVGRVAHSGEPLLLPGLHGDEEWIADREWFQREGIRTFAAQPLVFRGEILGVLAIFDRDVLGGEDFDWLRIFADHAAVSIVNANAFEEIAFLKERLEEENSYLREEVSAVGGAGDLVGDSPALRKVLQQIDLVAPTDATVLITGETGTGKELVARAIHERSPRRDRAMIKVNCGAVPEALFESEFFGHARGAFTGALRDKAGRFELADRGTLFLDEIGEVPLPMQAKLLRVLQEQEIERVGDPRPRKIDVRIVAATNRDLRVEVEAGRFRQDLYYRLSVFPIENPPLRERREDIPPLAEHFVRTTAQRLGRKPPKLTPAAAHQLAIRDWPGNVRELQNAIERAVILSRGAPLVFDLPPVAATLPASDPTRREPSTIFTSSELKQRDRDNLAAALTQTGGKIFGPQGAAALLGLKPTTLASRMKTLGLERATFRPKRP